MRRIVLITLLLFLLIMGGCKEQLPDYTLGTAPSTEPTGEFPTTIPTQPREWREYPTYPVERPRDNVVGNSYYYTNSRAICYYDPELRRKVFLCSQPNCTHGDDRCTAFLGGGGSTQYQVVGDMAYALVDGTDTDGTILFFERNLITGEDRLLWDLTPEEDLHREYFGFSVLGDVAFLCFRQFEFNWREDGSYSEKDVVCYSYEIDLRTGERELLLEGKAPSVDSLCLPGDQIVHSLCTEEYLLIVDMEYGDELPMSYEEYFKKNPTKAEEDYWDDLADIGGEFAKSAHYSVNRRTGERKKVWGSDVEARHQDLAYIRDRQAVFVNEENMVCIYNGYTGEVTPYFEQKNIGLLMYQDGRIMFNVWPEQGGDGTYTYFWYDIQTGERQQFQEGISVMVFSIHEETADYFVGNYKGRVCFISKQDFYNENYDAAF